MIAIPLLVWYSTFKNKDVPTNGLVYPLGNVFFRIYARVGNVRSRPAPQGIPGRRKKRMENFTELAAMNLLLLCRMVIRSKYGRN